MKFEQWCSGKRKKWNSSNEVENEKKKQLAESKCIYNMPLKLLNQTQLHSWLRWSP